MQCALALIDQLFSPLEAEGFNFLSFSYFLKIPHLLVPVEVEVVCVPSPVHDVADIRLNI